MVAATIRTRIVQETECGSMPQFLCFNLGKLEKKLESDLCYWEWHFPGSSFGFKDV